MKCPKCGKSMRCINSRGDKERVYRRHECAEHGRFSSVEVVIEGAETGKDIMLRAARKLDQDYKATKLAWLNEQLEELNG